MIVQNACDTLDKYEVPNISDALEKLPYALLSTAVSMQHNMHTYVYTAAV